MLLFKHCVEEQWFWKHPEIQHVVERSWAAPPERFTRKFEREHSRKNQLFKVVKKEDSHGCFHKQVTTKNGGLSKDFHELF